jgi:hypothetical protein
MQSSSPDIRACVGRRKFSHFLSRIINPILKSFRFGLRAKAPNETQDQRPRELEMTLACSQI